VFPFRISNEQVVTSKVLFPGSLVRQNGREPGWSLSSYLDSVSVTGQIEDQVGCQNCPAPGSKMRAVSLTYCIPQEELVAGPAEGEARAVAFKCNRKPYYLRQHKTSDVIFPCSKLTNVKIVENR